MSALESTTRIPKSYGQTIGECYLEPDAGSGELELGHLLGNKFGGKRIAIEAGRAAALIPEKASFSPFGIHVDCFAELFLGLRKQIGLGHQLNRRHRHRLR